MTDDPASRDAFRWEIRQSLVERLRIPWEGMGEMANQQRAEAAVQISTMMDELEALRLELDRMVDKLTAQRDAARRERDEARRDLCYSNEWRACPYEVARKKATECGWDCFKEKP